MTQKDITGQRFGKLTALKPLYIKNNKWYWLFKCDCGKECSIRKQNVINGNTKSCGCIHRNILVKRNKKHLMSNSKIYIIYAGMKARCTHKYGENCKYYAGRGIKVCKDWENNFMSFYEWAIKNGYKDGLTIDRINNNGDYCPENCRWVTNKEQARNRSSNRLISYNGKTLCLIDWAKAVGIKRETLARRLNAGWTTKDALTTPVNK